MLVTVGLLTPVLGQQQMSALCACSPAHLLLGVPDQDAGQQVQERCGSMAAEVVIAVVRALDERDKETRQAVRSAMEGGELTNQILN